MASGEVLSFAVVHFWHVYHSLSSFSIISVLKKLFKKIISTFISDMIRHQPFSILVKKCMRSNRYLLVGKHWMSIWPPIFHHLRESLLMRDDDTQLQKYPEYAQYRHLLEASLQVLFERFWLHWSFSHISLSSQWPLHIVQTMIRDGRLSPWIQKNATFSRLQVDPVNHWLHYCDTLDPLFSVHPHPLLALVRSVFIPTHEDI